MIFQKLAILFGTDESLLALGECAESNSRKPGSLQDQLLSIARPALRCSASSDPFNVDFPPLAQLA